MTEYIQCPEDGCGGRITFDLRRKGRMDKKGSLCYLDARCDRCDFRHDGIQTHKTGIFCFSCNEWRDNSTVCESCIKKKLYAVKENNDLSKWLRICPAEDCGRPMTVVNVFWSMHYDVPRLQAVYYCFEHEFMVVDDVDITYTEDLRMVSEKDGTI